MTPTALIKTLAMVLFKVTQHTALSMHSTLDLDLDLLKRLRLTGHLPLLQIEVKIQEALICGLEEGVVV